MKPIPNHIRTKLDQANEFYPKILASCIDQLKSPGDMDFTAVASYLGSMAHGLRAALNYAMWDFAEGKLKPVLSKEKFKGLEWQHDFPMEDDEARFTKQVLVRYAADYSKEIYRFLEEAQPFFHTANAYLRHLRRLTNTDTHTLPIETVWYDINSVLGFFTSGETRTPRASIFGDKLMFPRDDGSVRVYQLPCYFEPYHMFASSTGKWLLLLITVNDQKLGLLEFAKDVNRRVDRLLSEFYKLL